MWRRTLWRNEVRNRGPIRAVGLDGGHAWAMRRGRFGRVAALTVTFGLDDPAEPTRQPRSRPSTSPQADGNRSECAALGGDLWLTAISRWSSSSTTSL